MSENDTPNHIFEFPKRVVSDVATAATVLTRFPVPSALVTPERLTQSTWAYPIVGAIVGLIAGLILWGATLLGLVPEAAAILCLGASMLMTGALHEDGLADCADGLGGGRDKEKALSIMRDSRIGAYGVVVLCLFILGRWVSIESVVIAHPIASMMLVGAVSRAPMTAIMTWVPNARTDGMSKHVGRPAPQHAFFALLIALAIGALTFGSIGLICVVIGCAATIPLVLSAKKKIGGQTGDVLGGSQQMAELAILMLLASFTM